MDERHQFHRAEVAILDQLRHAKTSRFSDLMKPTGLESDVFKFHIKKLVKLGYIEKNDIGHYRLTANGKGYAGDIDIDHRTIKKRPRLSVMIVARKKVDGQERFLVRKRPQAPFFGYWGLLTTQAIYGVDFLDTARGELYEETGIEANFVIKMFYRSKTYLLNTDQILLDNLFVVVEAEAIKGDSGTQNDLSNNKWVTTKEFNKLTPVFRIDSEIFEDINIAKKYISKDLYLSLEQF